MQFATYLCFVVCVRLSLADQTVYGDDFFSNINIFAWNVDIPENSYWSAVSKPTWSDASGLSIGTTPYQSVNYLKKINSTDDTMIAYTIRQLTFTTFFNRWKTISINAVPFCDNATIPSLIRRVLGNPEACPVPEGWQGEVKAQFRFADPLNLGVNVTTPYLKIVTNVWSDNTLQAERLFSGTFFVTKMEKADYQRDIHSRTSF